MFRFWSRAATTGKYSKSIAPDSQDRLDEEIEISANPLAFAPRRLILMLGDQLNRDSTVCDDGNKARDAAVMLEVAEEAEYVPQHKLRLTLFFSAMRHFRDQLRDDGWQVCYTELDERNNRGNLADELSRWLNKTRAESLLVCRPGDYRVLGLIEQAAQAVGCQLDLREDCHFYSNPQEFSDYTDGRENLRLEHFYRWMRKRHDILIEDGKPVGGDWNYDADNRKSFGREGPGKIKAPRSFRPDALTREVMAMIEKRYPDHPGVTDDFEYPVTHVQAQAALCDFVKHRLVCFGDYQDAMAAGRPYLYHSRLSAVLNLHLLDPRSATSESACPFTVLYWDFLSRNRQRIGRTRRLGLQYRNLDRKSDRERRQIRQRARVMREAAANGEPL
jgi:deoxyribodipyrimidine photolyase-related protein